MADAPKFYGGGYPVGALYGGRWRTVRVIGKGGQGLVYEVEDIQSRTESPEEQAQRVKTLLREITRTVHHMDDWQKPVSDFISEIRMIAAVASFPRAALKELLPFDQAVNAKAAETRLATEMRAMRELTHPNLIRLLDCNPKERWLVTELYRNGSLEKQIDTFKGRVLDGLVAFRGLVSGVAALHETGLVHRDIKPGNVFFDADGALVLGDMGLVFEADAKDRVTDTFENVGTRDFMPGWAMGIRVENVRPSFDVFALGKLLWTMISGRPKLQLWYHRDERFDLERQFPDDPDISFVAGLLGNTVVEYERDCLPTARELLKEVDIAIRAVRYGAQHPSLSARMRCRFCGVGEYDAMPGIQADGFADPSDRRYTYICDHCGHLESFIWRRAEIPPAWRQD